MHASSPARHANGCCKGWEFHFNFHGKKARAIIQEMEEEAAARLHPLLNRAQHTRHGTLVRTALSKERGLSDAPVIAVLTPCFLNLLC
jgi:hypothetical protein